MPSSLGTWVVLVAAVLSSFSVLSCGASMRPVVRELSSASKDVLSKAPDVYGPTSVPALWGEPEDNQQVLAAFMSGLKPEVRSGMTHDPALDLAAAAMLYTYSDDREMPSEPLQQWTVWRAGVPRQLLTYCQSFSGGRGRDNVPSYFDRWMQECAAGLSSARATYGGVRVKLGRNDWFQMVLVASGAGTLGPLPMTAKPGEPITFRAKVADGYTDPVLYMDDPDKGVSKVYLKREAEQFSTTVAMPMKPGRYYFEIMATDPRTDPAAPAALTGTSIAWAPLFVGVPADTAPDRGLVPAETKVAGDVSAVVLSAYNAERSQFALPPMTLDPTLSRIADERAARWAREKKATPLEKDFDKQLSSMGIEVEDVSWNARSYEFLLDSLPLSLRKPSRRSRILWGGPVSIGIGTVEVPAKQTETYYQDSYNSFRRYEVMAKLVPPFELEKERAEVLSSLNDLRAEAGDPPLVLSAEASAVAQKLADKVCHGERQPEDTKMFAEAVKTEMPSIKKYVTSRRWGGEITRAAVRTAFDNARQTQVFPQVALGMCRGNFLERKNYKYALIAFVDP